MGTKIARKSIVIYLTAEQNKSTNITNIEVTK